MILNNCATLIGGGSWTTQGAVPTANHPRLARANQLTRMAHLVVANLQHMLAECPAERRAIVGATTLATIRANIRYQRRRTCSGIAAPRDFAHTATNGWIGEITAAHQILGPCTCLVGSDAALQAVATAVCWLNSRSCDQVIVMAAESLPETPELLQPHEKQWKSSAACILLQHPTFLPSATSVIATVSVDFNPDITDSHKPELVTDNNQTVSDLHGTPNTMVHFSMPTEPSVQPLLQAYDGARQQRSIILKSTCNPLEIHFIVNV